MSWKGQKGEVGSCVVWIEMGGLNFHLVYEAPQRVFPADSIIV